MVQTGRKAVEPDQIASFVQWRESAPPSIRSDLGVWYWLGQVLTVDVLLGVVSVMVPSLIERDGVVLLRENSSAEDFDRWMEQTGRDRAAVQHQLNHVHVRDLVSDPEAVPGHASSRRDAMGSAWELQ